MRSTRTVARSGSMVFALALWVGVLALVILPVAAHAAGSVYVANARSGGSTVSQFAIGAGGLLSPLSPATVAADSEPLAVAVTPDGRSVYVTNAGRNTVSQYTVDPSTGALSPKVPATVATGPSQTGPAGVAVTPDGKSAYVTNASGNTVAQFTIDLVSGVLSPKTPATLATGTSPHGVAVTPDGKSVYVTNFGLNPPESARDRHDLAVQHRSGDRRADAQDSRHRTHRRRTPGRRVSSRWQERVCRQRLRRRRVPVQLWLGRRGARGLNRPCDQRTGTHAQ